MVGSCRLLWSPVLLCSACWILWRTGAQPRNKTSAFFCHSTHTHTHSPYFEGFLRGFTGADDNQARSPHAAEALQVQPLQHRHSRHGVVLDEERITEWEDDGMITESEWPVRLSLTAGRLHARRRHEKCYTAAEKCLIKLNTIVHLHD